jgi:pimeloyl-ACP methyl ester carboxylesterase
MAPFEKTIGRLCVFLIINGMPNFNDEEPCMDAKILRPIMTLIIDCLVIVASLSVAGAAVTTTYVNLGGGGTGLLRVPSPLGSGARSHIGIFTTHPSASFLNSPICTELANRGYVTLCADNPFSFNALGYKGYEDHAPVIKAGINYLRSIPGISRIIIVGHSMGGPLMAFYQNVAQNGAAACQGVEKLISCDATNLSSLPGADGLILLDSHLGDAVATMTYVDPAIRNEEHPGHRNAHLDMFDPRNGYDLKTNSATYSADFKKRYLKAQAERNEDLIEAALEELSKIVNGEDHLYPDDMPYNVAGANAARLWQPDISLLKQSEEPRLLLKADGTDVMQVISSVRLPSGRADMAVTFAGSHLLLTVRRFLGAHAVRTTKDYNQLPDDITGIDYASSATSTPSNIQGVTVPLLIVVMGAHYFIRPDEIILSNAASADKTYAAVEGATHGFTPCTACATALGLPSTYYGNTVKRLFDYVDDWLSAGRF